MNAARRGAVGAARRAATLAAVVGLSMAVAPMAQAAPTGGIVAGILPVAVDDASTVVHGRTRTVAAPGVMANDLQVGSGFTARLVSGPAHGSLDLDANGGYTYTADLAYVGEDTFRYRVDGGLLGLSNTATVRIAVTNVAPVARADAYTAVAGVQRSVAAPGILGNDDDGDGDALTIDLVAQPAGALVVGADGRVRYTADAGFAGVDTFTYRVTDGAAWSGTVQVRITVSAPDPTASPTASPTPKPTPAPTPAPTDASTPRPTATGGRTPTPTTSTAPSPTRTPPGATAAPSASAGASAPVPPSGGPGSAEPSGPATSPTPIAGGFPPGPGASGGPSQPAASRAPTSPGAGIALATTPNRSAFDFDTVDMAFDGFEWAVPGLVLTVPGLLLMLAVVFQSVTALGWLRVTRRWLGGDRTRGDGVQRLWSSTTD